MKKTSLFALCAISASMLAGCVSNDARNTSVTPEAPVADLPVPFEQVFNNAMNDPNVVLYYADQAYRKQDYDNALRWMLEAARYDHPAAIANAKHLILNNQGTEANREAVVPFLTYFAQPRGAEPADLFAQLYLADYYRGDPCVWFAPTERAECAASGAGPSSATDLRQSYFYYEAAAERGDARSQYSAGMMNLLGLGVPRNVPLALDFLRPLAESGNAAVSYLIGSVYQLGYWMPQDRAEASKWFMQSAKTKHPGALLYLAKNAESGITAGDVKTRIAFAVEAYHDVLSGVLATNLERAEAAYRLGLIYASDVTLRDEMAARASMYQSADLATVEPNEFGVQALIWLGARHESSNLSVAVEHYLRGYKLLKELPLDVQQRHAVVLEKIAYAYGRGQDGVLERDERTFSKYMSERHELLAKSHIPQHDTAVFQGYTAFSFPG